MPKLIDHPERKRELLEHAWNLTATSGITAVTVRTVAAASGRGTSSLRHVFPTQERLLRELAALMGRRMSAALGTVPLSSADPARILGGLLPGDERGVSLWRVWAELRRERPHDPIVREVQRRIDQVVHTAAVLCVHRNVLLRPVESAIVTSLSGLHEGFIAQLLDENRRLEIAGARAAIDFHIGLLKPRRAPSLRR